MFNQKFTQQIKHKEAIFLRVRQFGLKSIRLEQFNKY